MNKAPDTHERTQRDEEIESDEFNLFIERFKEDSDFKAVIEGSEVSQ